MGKNVAISHNKKTLGKYMTTNYDYILQGMSIPKSVSHIVEPFAGDGKLIEFCMKTHSHITMSYYDIQPEAEKIVKRDTLHDPPDYSNAFVVTNPPYIARNKNKNKDIYDKYGLNDLYKCFIHNLCETPAFGGIIIIPINFLSSIRKRDIQLRKEFFTVYDITRINVFEEKVFTDARCSVCSIQFKKKIRICDNTKLNIHIYPTKDHFTAIVNSKTSYSIGGKIYNLPTSDKYKFTRLVLSNMNVNHTCIVVKCIDDNKTKQICASIVPPSDVYIDNTKGGTNRTYITLVSSLALSESQQKILADGFNDYIRKHRSQYRSLFLPNFRDNSDIARKRISFDLVYKVFGYIALTRLE